VNTRRCNHCDRPDCPTLSVPPDAPDRQALLDAAEENCDEHCQHSDCMTGYLVDGHGYFDCDGTDFNPLQAELGKVIFREMEINGVSLVEVQKSLAQILWGMLGGFDRDDLTSVSVRREGDTVQMVVEWDDDSEDN